MYLEYLLVKEKQEKGDALFIEMVAVWNNVLLYFPRSEIFYISALKFVLNNLHSNF
jgi:hypothetical protein